MKTITITLPEPILQKLKELAREANAAPEELIRSNVEEWLRRPHEDYAEAANYILQKNAALYRRLASGTPGEEYCCDRMRQQVERTCEIHGDRFDCPDCLVMYSEQFREYGLIVHDGGRSKIRIEYCPWCGCRLSENIQDTVLGEA